MRVAAVICEYNPFHHGHAYQLTAARRDCSADVVLCVMSEYLTQRGELAVADPYTRAEAAILGGADVVVGLPFPYSGASAEFFATAGIRIADALGATHLHFGSECGDIDTLQRLADLLGTSTFADALTAWQRTHPDRGIMAAREAVLRQLCPDAPLPDGSNDLLALAYLTAIATQKSPLIPVTVARNGQDYRDDTDIDTTYASASALRRLWQSSKELSVLQSRLPSGSYAALLHAVQAGNAPADADRLLAAVQLFLRRSDPIALSTLAELGGGLAQRMITAARASAYQTLPQLIAAAATKRYTNARIARAIWFGMCGVTATDLSAPPAYTRLLGCSKAGKAYLASIRKQAGIPVITKPADLPCTPAAARQQALQRALCDLYTLALPTPRDAAFYLRAHPYLAPDEAF